MGKNKKYFTLYSPALLPKEKIHLEQAEKSDSEKLSTFPSPLKTSIPNNHPLIGPADSERSPIFVEKNQVKSNGSFALRPPRTIIIEGGGE